MAVIDKQWVLEQQRKREACRVCGGTGYILIYADQVAAPIGAEPCPKCSSWRTRSMVSAARRLPRGAI